MPINIGYIEGYNDDVTVRIYYDNTVEATEPQPLIDGPRGFCVDLTNLSGRNRKCVFTLPDGTEREINIGQGDPVTTGPQSGRSRTVAQVNTMGFFLRSDVAGFSGPE